MTLNHQHIRELLRSFDLQSLFTQELGWDHHRSQLTVQLDGQGFALSCFAQKRGVQIFQCSPDPDGRIPDYLTRRRIEREVTKSAHEHLIIFVDTARRNQVWQWVHKQPGRPPACREQSYHTGQTGQALIEKFASITFSLSEEEGLTLSGVLVRLKDALDKDHVTRRFYDRFKTEHAAFLGFLRGIPDEGMQRWYASVMLNRLTFIYFIQKRGFLDGDTGYLRNRLEKYQRSGRDLYYTQFLCPLFFEGFAKRPEDRAPDVNRLLGRVPYLNGGLFLRHQIEEAHGATITIADAAFERLFSFFDQYQWHLDERPLAKGDEINPDVLGYIFEKYINQKEMGAYYTKEDITGYIARNTIIPFLFDAARQNCRIAFQGEESVWKLLSADPERYIYEAVKKGVTLSLPDQIAAGLDDVSKRTQWNRAAPEEYALPTEIWREVVARRKRYEEIWLKLAGGEVREINELITYNLDVCRFAQDVIQECEGPELLRAFWHAIQKVTVLDPTCGSGAFLFAALNILEPLYEACLERMRSFLDDLDLSGEKHHSEKFGDFRKTLERVEKHPNHRYFVLKSIILNNLFGVDIMDEAVEICKLRLFLKLVAQVEEFERIEPLPDIDFNIRAGNTLVGFASYDDVLRAITLSNAGQMKMLLEEDTATMERIEQRAGDARRLFDRFREQQTEFGGEITAADKHALRVKLSGLDDELNKYLAKEYAVVHSNYRHWLSSHKPLHWFIEFYGIIEKGGFDVIIGNPPFVELASLRSAYRTIGFATESCGNTYALCVERSSSMLARRGWLGMVVQQPFVSTQRMRSGRDVILNSASHVFSSTFDDRPSKLFEGMHHARIALILARKATKEQEPTICVSRYHKWYKEERPFLFENMSYIQVPQPNVLECFPKVGSTIELELVHRLASLGQQLGRWIAAVETPHKLYYKITGVGHWFTITARPPKFLRQGLASSSTREESICFGDEATKDTALAVLNSSLFYWFYQVRTNCRDFNPSDFRTFPVADSFMSSDCSSFSLALQQDLDSSSELVAVNHKLAGAIQVERFKPREAKHTIDQIDCSLAKHYQFTDEQLDFIINYDIKYRMGRDGDQDLE